MTVTGPASSSDDFFTAREVSRRRGAGCATVPLVVVGLAVVLVLLLVAADLVARPLAESRAAAEIEDSLPAGSTGGVDVDIHGFSVILQAVRGRLDDVTITGDDLALAGVPVGLRVDVADVPVDGRGTTGRADGTVTVDGDALNALQAVRDTGGSFTLGDGEVTFDRSFEVPLLGDVPVRVTGEPVLAADGSRLTVTPTAASVPGSGLRIDDERVLSTFALDLCAAQYVPEQIDLVDLDVRPEGLSVGLTSAGLPLSSDAFTSRGTC